MTVLLLDIDGVLNEPQQPINDDMRSRLAHADMPIYFVTGNTFTKSIDILGWHSFSGIFCNNGDELRDRFGYCQWRDEVTPALPKDLGVCLDRSSIGARRANNTIEWRSERFVNYSHIGRYATEEERLSHVAKYKDPYGDWRDTFIPELLEMSGFGEKGIEAVKGGAVSVDIYSKGADKARAAKYLNDNGNSFIFIGDKTAPGGNDYCVLQYCEENKEIKNRVFTSNGPSNTIAILNSLKNQTDNIRGDIDATGDTALQTQPANAAPA